MIYPSKYVQGPGEMGKLGSYAEGYGSKALVLISSSGYKRIQATLDAGFAGSKCAPVYDFFNGECSKNEINRLQGVMDAQDRKSVV